MQHLLLYAHVHCALCFAKILKNALIRSVIVWKNFYENRACLGCFLTLHSSVEVRPRLCKNALLHISGSISMIAPSSPGLPHTRAVLGVFLTRATRANNCIFHQQPTPVHGHLLSSQKRLNLLPGVTISLAKGNVATMIFRKYQLDKNMGISCVDLLFEQITSSERCREHIGKILKALKQTFHIKLFPPTDFALYLIRR